MSSPTFTTLPREIRDRIYDFVWDLGKTVSPKLWSQRCVRGFENFPTDVVLALLRVNHQISAEATSTFYGKRKFKYPFLAGHRTHKFIALRGHLIKAFEMYFNPSHMCWNCPQTFDTLQVMDALRSFTIWIAHETPKNILEYLAGSGIYKLVDRMEVTVRSERTIVLDRRKYGVTTHWEEYVTLTHKWTCEKGKREWKSPGLRCLVHFLVLNDGSTENTNNVSSQVCDHDHHRSEHS